MKGDRVEVVVDTGDGTQSFVFVASRNGRRLEVATARGVVEVTEVTRGGTPVRTGRFMATRVVALVEHPALEDTAARVEIEATRAGRRIEVTTARGVVEVTEVTRGGTPVRTGRFMASRLIALVEHPAREQDGSRVDVTTRRRMRGPRTGGDRE